MEKDTKGLSIQNKYVFAEVMRNKEICKEFLKRALPEISVGELVYIESEKTIDAAPDSHGIRVDVYAEDGEHIYDVEMQVRNEDDLPWRSRYSAALLDEVSLERNREYSSLRESFVIFICLFDPFKREQKKYTFRNYCEEEPGLPLADGVTRVFLNTKGSKGNVSRQLQNFLDYVDGHSLLDKFVKSVDKAVNQAKANKELRAMIAKWEIERNSELSYARRDGHALGRAEGRAEGLAEGRAEGLAEGKAEGLAEGKAEGLAEGIKKGQAKEQRKTEKERKRADVAEAEVARLREELKNLKKKIQRGE